MDGKEKQICEKVLLALARVNEGNRENIWWDNNNSSAKVVLPLCYGRKYDSREDVSLEASVLGLGIPGEGAFYAKLWLGGLRFAKTELSPWLMREIIERYDKIENFVEEQLNGKRLSAGTYLLPISKMGCLDEKVKE